MMTKNFTEMNDKKTFTPRERYSGGISEYLHRYFRHAFISGVDMCIDDSGNISHLLELRKRNAVYCLEFDERGRLIRKNVARVSSANNRKVSLLV